MGDSYVTIVQPKAENAQDTNVNDILQHFSTMLRGDALKCCRAFGQATY